MRTWMREAAVGVLALFGQFLSPWSWAQQFPQELTELVSKARAQVNMVSMTVFKAGLDQKSLGLVIDVREPAEFAGGHVPGAINIPRGLIEFRIWSHVGYPDKLDKNQKIVIYCGTGARAALAAKSLRDLHFNNVTAVDMTIEDWRKSGYPLELG